MTCVLFENALFPWFRYACSSFAALSVVRGSIGRQFARVLRELLPKFRSALEVGNDVDLLDKVLDAWRAATGRCEFLQFSTASVRCFCFSCISFMLAMDVACCLFSVPVLIAHSLCSVLPDFPGLIAVRLRFCIQYEPKIVAQARDLRNKLKEVPDV